MPNSKSAVLFSKGTDLRRVLQSLDVIMTDLRLQAQDEEQENVSRGPEPSKDR